MKKLVLSICALILCFSATAAAATDDNLSKENSELKQRVERLEKELAEIKSLILKKDTAADQPPASKPVSVSSRSDEEIEKISQRISKKKEPKIKVVPYGYIKADAVYDTSTVNTGNFIKWVEQGGSNDSEFNITANQTRLGLKVFGTETDDLNVSGLVEVDFYGGNSSGASKNKSHPFMRHAFLKMDWPEKRFDIIAGQTWDVISPLNPFTLNYSVAWWAGNIGYRRPQIRLTKSYALSENVDLKLEGAIATNIGSNVFNVTDSGEDSGQPVYQARTSLAFPMLAYKPTTVGFSGHWGKEEFDTNDRKFDTWSLNFDVTQPLNKWLTIQSELFTGENLNQFLGGIGQGINTTTFDGISTKGGWVAANIGPFDKWRFNTGLTMESVDRDDLNTNDRSVNSSIFGNVIYAFNENTDLGFELSRWRTDYKNASDEDDLRFQTSFVYKF